jgi:hypothetical protein
MSFDPDIKLILTAFETPDDIGKILRCHLVVEGQIEKLVTSFTTAKVDDRTPFASKVNLARAMGVPEGVCLACAKLNHLRNQFAHSPHSTFESEASAVGAFLNATEKIFPILPKSHGSFGSATSKSTRHEFTYADADLGRRVVVASSFLSASIGALPKLYRFGPPVRLATMAGFDL